MGQTNLSAKNEFDLLTAIYSGITALGGGAGSYTDRSLSITTGGTAQNIVATNSSRKSVIIQNPSSEKESIFVNPTGTATANGDSLELTPGGSITFATTQAISVLAATTGHKVVAKELT